MLELLIGVWIVLAIVVAVILGRVARRGDTEELGSTRNWDVDSLGHEVQHES